jgi:hypothetical protein
LDTDRLRVATSRAVINVDNEKPEARSNFPQIVQTADSGAHLPLLSHVVHGRFGFRARGGRAA